MRVITAMNVDPAQAVEQGRLRLDLFHCLNVFPIFLPPLRERLEDTVLLVRYLLDKEDFSEIAVSPEVIELFRQYAWPGNIRELRNVVVRAAAQAANRLITQDVLPLELLSRKLEVFLPPASSRRYRSPFDTLRANGAGVEFVQNFPRAEPVEARTPPQA